MPTNYPPRLAPESMPWARLVDRRQSDIETSIRQAEQNTLNNNKQNTSTFGRLQQQISVLNQAAQVQQADGGGSSGTGWFNGARPSVTITSPTGRVEIQYGATLGPNGEAYCCYSASGGADIQRESFVNGSYQMITIATASFPQTGYRTQIVDVAPGQPTTFTLEYLVNGGAFQNGSIYARVVL